MKLPVSTYQNVTPDPECVAGINFKTLPKTKLVAP